MTKIFVGILMVIVIIPFGTTRIVDGMIITTAFNLLPNFIGYYFIVVGLEEIENISRRFKKMKRFVVALGIYDLAGYAFLIFGSPIIVHSPMPEIIPDTAFRVADIAAVLPQPLPSILGVVLIFTPMFVLYNIVMGIREFDIGNDDMLNSKKLYTAWKWFAVCTAIVILLPYITFAISFLII